MTDNISIRYEFWSYDGDGLCIDYYYFVYLLLCLKIRLFCLKNQQFITQSTRTDCSSYNITTLHENETTREGKKKKKKWKRKSNLATKQAKR